MFFFELPVRNYYRHFVDGVVSITKLCLNLLKLAPELVVNTSCQKID